MRLICLVLSVSMALIWGRRAQAADDAVSRVAEISQTARDTVVWEAEGRLVTESATNGGQTTTETPFRLLVQDPADPNAAHARLEVTGGARRFIRICDAMGQWTYITSSKHVWRLTEAGIAGCAQPFLEWMDLPRGLHSATVVGKESLDVGDREVECTILEADFDDGSPGPAVRRTLWIGDSTGTIWKYRIAQTRGEADRSVRTYTFSWQALAGIRRPEEFWIPPKIEGAVEITPTSGEAELTATSAPPIAPAEAVDKIYRLGGSVSPPKLIRKVEPMYTEAARQARIQGTVILVAEVGSDGKARNFRIVQSLDPGLDQKAIEAVAQWTFQPGTRGGTPVTMLATFEVNFRLRR